MSELDPRATMSTIIASVSGGKDSAAMCLYLRELGLTNVKRVFADTGWEHPDTYAYLRGPLTDVLGPIDEVTGRDGGMAPLIRRKKMFPSRLKRFCTEELKVFPLRDYVERQAEAGLVVNAVGIRHEESASRAAMAEWEWSETFDCWVWRPIVRWTEQHVIDIHTRHGLVPNPLYLRGASRVGCWPCIFARKSEIRRLGEESPERVAEIVALEDELPPVAAKDDLPPMKKTFFHGKITRSGIPLPIEAAVAWANTAHGTKDQGVLWHDLGQPEGCVRWGLCESAKPGEDDDESPKAVQP